MDDNLPVEIEVDDTPVVDDDGTVVTPLEDGGTEFDFSGEEDLNAGPPEEVDHYENLAELMDEDDLAEIGQKLMDKVDQDRQSRSEWEDTYVKGLSLLGMKFEERTSPWRGACGISHPLLSEAAVRFQSQAISEIFPPSGPARTKLAGKITEEKTKQGHRVEELINYICTEEMPDARDETDRLLFCVPLAGSAFKKTYWNEQIGAPESVFVPPEDIIVPYGATSLKKSPRITHRLPMERNTLKKMQHSGFYSSVEVGDPVSDDDDISRKIDKIEGRKPVSTDSDMYTLYEVHCELDLPGFEDEDDGVPTGIALPYVVTVVHDSDQVLSIRRNWAEDDQRRLRQEHFTHYQYIPAFGFYGLGLIHLIGGIAQGATSILRQLVDAGTLANLPGGFKTRGLRLKGDQTPIGAGEWRDVDVVGGRISDSIYPLPYKEPSATLQTLLYAIIEEGRRFASLNDLDMSSMNGEAPVGTTLALLERVMKVMTAIQARMHASMRNELTILTRIVKDNYTEYPYEVDDGVDLVSDLDARVDVIPVSDPNSSTMAQRIMTYQAAHQLSMTQPNLYNHALLHRDMLNAMGLKDAERIVPTGDDLKPMDPVSENMNLLNGEPVKAFMHQDHQSHIQVHLLGMQDPKVAQVLEGSPEAPMAVAAGMAHVTEHLAFEYRAQIEEKMGVSLPPPGEELPPEIEVELSKLVASASTKLFAQSRNEVAQAQADEDAQDPILQAELKKLKLEEIKIVGDLEAKADKLQLDADRLKLDYEIKLMKIKQEAVAQAEQAASRVQARFLDAAATSETLDSNERIAYIEAAMKTLDERGNEREQEIVRDQRNREGNNN